MDLLPLPTEADLTLRLRQGEVLFPPLEMSWEEPKIKEIDGILRVSWRKKSFRFAAECKRFSNLKNVEASAEQARKLAQVAKVFPLVVVPYLNEEALNTLERMEVSGIDLCGNGVIIVPGEWYVRCFGHSNLFRAEGTIKNVYRKSSSVAARLFLTNPEFESVQDALEEVGRLGGRVTLSTVSKVCKRLEEDLIIERKRDGTTKLRLVQPEKLLDRLAANYSSPEVKKRITGKLRGIDVVAFRTELREWARTTGNQISLTGTSSVAAYAVMARGETEASYYCTDVAGAVRSLGDRFQPTERFASVTLLETRDKEVYFDRREDLTASPVETFLELASGDKRDQETAEQVRKVILNALSELVADGR